ncbi:MAG: hypothetical protein H6667_15320 [Ardenticatenaceae bacterium]|nr:hypothetical protein [Ardenticatenaceae bacterium]
MEISRRKRRLAITLGGLIISLFCGSLLLDSLNQYCHSFSIGECRRLWILTGISVLGSILFFEILLARRFRNKPDTTIPTNLLQEKENIPNRQSENVWRWSVTKSTIRLTLSSLLMGLPLLVQGMLVVTVFGIFLGLSADSFVRGVMNWLPTKHKD